MMRQEILQPHGITTLRAFMERAVRFPRQQAWSLWHGEAGPGRVMAMRPSEWLPIPIDELIQVDPVLYPKPR
jgi:hypothetical protein